MSSQSKQMDSEHSSLSTDSKPEGLDPYPLSSLEKTKAQEQPVQVMEFSIDPSHRAFGRRRALEGVTTHEKLICLPMTSKLDWVIESRTLSIQVTEFCDFKSVLVPLPDVSQLIPISIIGYVQSQSSTAHAMT